MESYWYRRLRNDEFSIRLLRIHPNGDSTSKIECELFHEEIDNKDRTPYEALSYTWGDASQTVDIQVNGCAFSVTVNLEAALRSLRKADDPRVLWVDAVCINQTDLTERAKQVRIMWDIYQAANCVVVWLGPEEGDSAIAMENFARREAQIRLPARNVWKRERPAEHKGHWCGCHAGDWETYPPRLGVLNIAERAWFTRVWVLQEVAAAKAITVVCGNKSVNGNDFCQEMLMSASFNRVFQQILPRIRPALELMNKSITGSVLGSRPLIELIESFRTLDATKAVDKVYALLAFSSDASKVPELQPDYTISQAVLARRLVRFAFPDSVISTQSANQDEIVFETEGLLLGTISSWSKDSEMFWGVKAGKSDLPNTILNQVALQLFQDRWDIRLASGRRLQEDSSVVLLRGASRPTVLRFSGGKYIVDMLATPEPLKDGMELVFQHLNSKPPEYRNQGWSAALEALSAESEGLMKFKLSWDPSRPLDLSEYSRYVPTLNSVETQLDAMLESMKDAAENGGKNHHDCNTITMLWMSIYADKENIEGGTSKHTMTLHKAAYNGYYGTVKLLLDLNVDVDSRHSKLNVTALHLAAIEGHTKIVKVLLDAEATVDSLDGDNKTPLCMAIDKGHSDVSRMLLESGADPHPGCYPPNFLLFTAVSRGYVDTVSALLEYGAHVDASMDFGSVAGPTSLHVAAEAGNPALVTALLAAKAQVNLRIMTGATPLHQAAINGHTEVIKLLLHAGADMNALDHDGMTPLDFAVYHGQLETAQEIWQAGGQHNATVLIDEEEDISEESKTTASSLSS